MNYSKLLKIGFQIIELPSRKVRYFINKQIQGKTIEGDPSFIVGCGHSGTSLLLAILGAHSRIYAIPYESRLAMKSNDEAQLLLDEFEQRTVAEGKIRWIEKTPGHILYIDKLFQLKPNAKVIIIIRDGRDVACSIKERSNFERGVESWIQANKSANRYQGHSQCLFVKYEDIIVDFKKTISSILDFMGESYENAMEQYNKKHIRFYHYKTSKPNKYDQSTHAQYRNWQINQNIFDGRGKWKVKMNDYEKALFKRLAGNMLIEYGYAENNDW
ncbi:sulfotransferase [Gracilimonas sp.]|uniref:sulfotransferase family protein n=1 Tax=Gracilimonas sp. TaxID=1974203 RepID=UPI0032EF1381